MLVLLQNKKTC